MRRYVLFVNNSRVQEFEELFFKKTYIKYFVKSKLIPGNYIYILTIGNSFKEAADFYVDTKNAKESGIVYFVGCEMLEED